MRILARLYAVLLAPFDGRGMAWFALLFLALIPIPLGANRPLAWIISAGCLGFGGLLYGLRAATRPNDALSPGSVGILGYLYTLHIGALLLQLLPIGALTGGMPLPYGLSSPQISIAPGATMLMVLRSLSYALLFTLVFVAARDRVRGRKLLYAMLAIISVHAAFGLISFRSGDTLLGMEKWAYAGAVTGTFVNRNSFATFMAFGLVLATCLLLDAIFELQRNRLHRGKEERDLLKPVLVTLAFVTILIALLGTQSRMGMAAGIIGVATVLTATALRQKRLGYKPFIALAGIAAILAPIVLLNLEGLMSRLLAVDQSWATRLELYGQTMELIAHRPLTGFGGGAFEIAFPLVHGVELGSDRLWDKAHNSYLALWSELGFVAGSIVPLTVMVAATLLMRKLAQSRAFMPQVTAALGIIAVAATHSLVDFSLEIQAVAYWFTAFLALGLAYLHPASARLFRGRQ